MSQILSSQGKNAPSDPYPHYSSAFSNLKVLSSQSRELGSDDGLG